MLAAAPSSSSKILPSKARFGYDSDEDSVIKEMDHLERLHLTCYADTRDEYLKYLKKLRGSKERGRRSDKNSRASVMVRPVEQCHIETGAVLRRYISVNAAAATMQISVSALTEACRGEQQRGEACGFSWRMYDGPLGAIEEESDAYISVQNLLVMKFKSMPRPGKQPALQLLTSTSVKSEDIDQSESLIKQAPALKFNIVTSRKRHRDRSERSAESMPINARVVEQLDINTRTVLRRYVSQKEAADTMQLSYKGISRCCQEGEGARYGFRWRTYTGPVLDLERDNSDSSRPSIEELLARRDLSNAPKRRRSRREMRELRARERETVTAATAGGQYESQPKPPPAVASPSPVQMFLPFQHELLKGALFLGSPAAGITETPDPNDGGRKQGGKSIEQYDLATGQVLHRYASVRVAAASMGYGERDLSRTCRGELGVENEFGWRYYTGQLLDFSEDNNLPGRKTVEELLAMKDALVADDTGDIEEFSDVEGEGGEEGGGEPVAALKRRAESSSRSRGSSKRARKSSRRYEDESQGAVFHGSVHNAVAVEQYDLESGATLHRYASMREASGKMHTSHKRIARCCKGAITEADGFGYRYYRGPPIDYDIDNLEPGRLPIEQLLSKKITATEGSLSENDQQYETTETSREDNEQEQILSSRSRSRQPKEIFDNSYAPGRRRSVPGFHPAGSDEEVIMQHPGPSRRPTAVDQLDLETGEVIRTFATQSAAAHHIGGKQQIISNACRGRASEAFGFGWRFTPYQD